MINWSYSFIILSFNLFFFQSNSNNLKNITIYKTDQDIILDGNLDEQFWKKANLVDNFFQQFPNDSIIAEKLTEVRLAYSNTHLYISAVMYDSVPEKYIVKSLKRDFDGLTNESVTFTFDTFYDQKNAYNFGVTPYNVQREAVISEGGTSNWRPGGGSSLGWFNRSWNTKWKSSVKKYDDFWITEISIPLRSIRYSREKQKWGFNVWRHNLKSNEQSNWTAIPRGYNDYNLSLAGELIFDGKLPKPGKNIILIPYLSGSAYNDFITNESKNFNPNIGLDMKIGLSSTLNLDVTVNPDFSQVEVDQQRTNLTRFELMYPEKREFFIENSDLFSDVGDYRIKPFFSRRIGIAYDSITNQYKQNPIIFGAKLSGKIGENYRIGLLNMQSSKLSSVGIPSTNYGMAVVERRILANSRISSFLINKQTINQQSNQQNQLYNRVAGVELKLLSKDTKISSDLYFNNSFDNYKTNNSFAFGGNAVYQDSQIRITNYFSKVGENYNPEVGFIRRKNVLFYSPSFRYLFYPKSGKVNSHGPDIDYEFYNHPKYKDTDRKFELEYSVNLINSSRFNLKFQRDFTLLLNNFDPTGTGIEYLQAFSKYRYNTLSFDYVSDYKRRFFIRFNSKIGEFFNGNIFSYDLSLNHKFVPYVNINLSIENNKIDLPYSSVNLTSYSSKIEVSFTTKLFLTSYFQYNKQIDNINFNTRFQWNFKPLSDIYLVYTDNYFAKGSTLFDIKNRSLALKLNYWINI